MMVSRVAIVALVATAFGTSAAMAECSYHKQTVEKETMTVMTDEDQNQSSIPEGSLAVTESSEETVTAPRTAAASKSE